MRFRRHHNNTGHRQIKLGRTYQQVRRMARRLGIPYGKPGSHSEHFTDGRECWCNPKTDKVKGKDGTVIGEVIVHNDTERLT